MNDYDDHIANELIVHKRRYDYQEKIDYYQEQVNEQENHIHDLIVPIINATERFFEQYGIIPICMKCIAILHFNY